MSRVISLKAAQLWAERVAQCERSNLSSPKSIATDILTRWATNRPKGIRYKMTC
jgi:hypothetical protein